LFVVFLDAEKGTERINSALREKRTAVRKGDGTNYPPDLTPVTIFVLSFVRLCCKLKFDLLVDHCLLERGLKDMHSILNFDRLRPGQDKSGGFREVRGGFAVSG
jgi:hypothetical protein